MDQVNWGIIGCGDVTEVKSGPAFQKVAHSNLVAVMRRNAEKASDYAQKHNVPKWYTDADLLINDPEINAVYVATPPDTHIHYAKKVIAAGKPVYIEKPMGLNYAECVEVNTLAKEKNVSVFVAYYRRMLDGFTKVKELIQSGSIGEVRMVSVQLFKHAKEEIENLPWRVKPEIAGGGHFFDLASHQFDFLMYLFGQIEEVHSIVENQAGLYEAEDILSVSFKFKNKILGNGIWCFNSSKANERDLIEIIGSKGRIELSTFDFIPIRLITEEGIKEFDSPKPEHVQFNLIEQIVKALRGEEECVSNGITGAETNRVLEEITRKYYTNQ